jgi:hypothetical protein
VTLTQKPETQAPEVGQALYGDITEQQFENKATGESFTKFKFKKQSRPDGFTPAPANGAAPAADGGGKDDAWWYQKDRRISRAGVLQAVVASGMFNNETPDVYVMSVNRITDALLASLDECAPHPSAQGSNYDAAEQHTPTDPEPEVPPVDVVVVRAKQLPPERWLLELAGFGADISNPEQAIRSLSERDRAKFMEKLEGIAQEKQPETAEVKTSAGLSDDDSIPF